VAPASVDTLLITHAHVDHVNGLLDDAGGALFPNADLFLHEAEAGFWLNKDVQAKAPEAMQMYFGIAQRALAPYAARTTLIKDGAEVLPGVTAVFLPGHTPGHTGFRIASGDATLLIWGDIVHLPGIQFSQPRVGMVFDADSEQAYQTRLRILDMVATDRVMIAGMHLDFPTFGHVEKRGDGYAFIPGVWTIALG
jgi:glyoxylase-like metal-dependent hydrolase (beta-lactamase superfamily II)